MVGFPYEEWPQDLKDEYAYNPTAAKKLLADAGYPNGFKTNCSGRYCRRFEVASNRQIVFCSSRYSRWKSGRWTPTTNMTNWPIPVGHWGLT